ncbi:16S rRNA (cytidine(1402)-2'-O)-methyltransferase [Chelativorans sp. AA-79]|uniref:16S rRNA (cytidine(1402)-2'-O)-methyltransferase n=1 Tax=Chelativorans sp. AA-79 TaxID=3028735 RepID=UPI0023F72B07|nr:16S rRNA (cytidine(1402)-2'-O)-methyltransferase [Chelativorans sp. AA-79]WEX09347.1 16S rRNA (cytidine(1402)-2'-O)-methyltransferase [Chelativorans sp. AA-79]
MEAKEKDGRSSFILGGAKIAAPRLAPALYLVATPIGNLSDITLRALETLAGADVLACEDTRVTRVLLERYGIRRRMLAYHEHNEAEATARLVAIVEEGRSVALASDAGTPLVSDPGFRLVRAAQERGVRVVPIPGPSAVLAALSVSGLPTDAFMFAGFLPSKAGQRRSRLEALASVPATLVFFESPRRIADSMAAMGEVLGPRQAVVARELTKAFEELRRGTLPELAAHYAEAGAPKGEIVVCIAPPGEAAPADADEIDRLLLALSAEMPASKAAGEAARMTGGRKSELYQRLLALKEGGDGR